MSVLGIGGGGGLMGLLNIASMFFPQLAVLSSLANMLTSAIGQGLKAGIDQLMQQSGLPKFLGDMVKKAIDSAVKGAQKDSTPEVDNATNKAASQSAKSVEEGFQKSFVDNAVQNMKSKKSKGSGSWLEALAEALGQALDAQAQKIQELSSQITDQNAKDKPSTMTELQTASQRMSFMMNAADQVIKTLGEALAAMSRKQ